ncbi:MAG: 2-amino-4-hydroxy-6-hydroxymethyldihydropteridine diphosphokinase [bacterium]
MNDVFLGMGSNKDDRLIYLKEALKHLSSDKNCELHQISSLYVTKPFGIKEQENYFNIAVRLSSSYDCVACLRRLKEIEILVGRTESFRWGPREIDIDLLFFNDLVYKSDELNIPHEGIINRDFVIVPLLEIEPELFHHGLKIFLKNIELSKLDNHIIEKQKFDFF